MKVLDTETAARTGVDVSEVERDSCTEFYLTGSIAMDYAKDSSTNALFSELADILARDGIQVIQEKVYGLRTAKEAIMKARDAALAEHGLDPALPVTFLEGKPARHGDFAGFQLWGVVPNPGKDVQVTTVKNSLGGSGRCLAGEGFRLFYFPMINGARSDGALPDCVTGQTDQMFQNASATLSAHNLTFKDVPRTWIYLARILDWYGEFNRVRTEHFEKVGLRRGDPETVFPASTGIQGQSHDEECVMDILALENLEEGAVELTPIRETSRQNQAFAYGSAFSRAMSVKREGVNTVYVSGTASINAKGETLYQGDAEAQSVETLLSIGALLEDQGGSLQNICQATLFCKDRESFEAYERVARQLNVPHFPTVSVIADVCRHDLSIEIEATAVI
ncbi:MAG: RidA family protein [Candidatus Hydrogenedentes bacterium]|nr:RidA family protein [Candidatus Hydrogenedentota bacterium]